MRAQQRAILGRRQTHGRLELPRERAVIGVAAQRRDVGHFVVRDKQRRGCVEPCLEQHLTRRQMKNLVEITLQLRNRHVRHRGQMRHVQRLHEVALRTDIGDAALAGRQYRRD